MLIKKILQVFILTLLNSFLSKEPGDIEILGIEPNAGPVYGETRVLVRIKDFDRDLIDDYDRPKCRFGGNQRIVNATYVLCSPNPRKVGDPEPTKEEKNETCIQCEISPEHEPDIVPFSVSLLGDFSDSKNSIPFRYYKEPIISYITPTYGKKNGGTLIEVYGLNFLNFDQNLRCAFGSIEVKGYYVSPEYMICYSPFSDVVQKELPFSISLNNQQNTRQNVEYVYYDFPQVARLEPNKGPDTGGTTVHIRGQYFNPSLGLSFNNYNMTLCRFGKLLTTVAKVISSTEIVCTSPPSYVDREVPVEITLNNQEWTDDGILFHYYHPPMIYSIEPRIGPVSGGTEVKVIGSNFVNTGFVICKFGTIIVKGKYVNSNELICSSPKVEKPGYVNLQIAIRPDEFSSGINTKYLYYDTPKINYIEPMCGPESGFTQITVYGVNFANTGSDFIKCVFNGTIFMNATVYSDSQIKCDSPSVLVNGLNERNISQYDLQITLNNHDLNGPIQKFYYYKDTYVKSITPIYGPKSGKTVVTLNGMDFTQIGACNVTIRIATYHIKPDVIERNKLVFLTPEVNFTGATVIQIALNGRQFDKDIAVHNRDVENTFYYYKEPLLRSLDPKKGPTIGGTMISMLGVGFDNVFYNQKQGEMKKMYYRFRNIENGKLLSEGKEVLVQTGHVIQVLSPQVYENNTNAIIELSYNNQDYDIHNDKLVFTYYILPNITNISPKYGPLNSEKQKIEIELDNFICTNNDNCSSMSCKFKSKTNFYIQKATYDKANHISCDVPKVNIPETYTVEASFNNDDYTNNNFNYTFYDPYVIKVTPQMVSTKGNTTIEIQGYGFADSGDFLKVQYGNKETKLQCGGKSCAVKAEFVSDELIKAVTFPMEKMYDLESGESIGFRKFPVEACVYNNDFTDNGISIFYYDEPEIIDDILSYTNLPLNITEKETISESIISSLPANLDTVIVIPIDSTRINKYYSQFNQFANYTCRFFLVNKDDNEKDNFKVTTGFVTSFPLDSNLNNIFLCQSPIWDKTGKAKVEISLNGYDFSENSYIITFTDPVKLYSISPTSGPRQGNTRIRVFGNGLLSNKDFGLKFGVQNIVPMTEIRLVNTYKHDELEPKIVSDYEIQEVEVLSPEAPSKDKTLGGPDYISYAKRNFLPIEIASETGNSIEKYFSSKYFHSNFEFYYYHQPYLQSFSPHGSIVTGGTTVLVVGAWFDYQPEYGVKPYCKFGKRVVEGEYLSTVRIKCIAPAYESSNIKVPFEVSLNGQDFTDSGLMFTYYNDYTKAKFYKIEPTSGPDNGGTNVKVFGESFTGMLDQDEFLCQFFPEDLTLQPKVVPAGFYDRGNNDTAIVCNTPGGWESGTKADIRITFDGQNYFDTGFDFYFYKIIAINPSSGPSIGNGPIEVIGSGFQNSTIVKCMLNKIEYKPIDIFPNKILCPMPQSSYGKNFTGAVDFGVTLNGIDWQEYDNGFYYYNQIHVDSIFPITGPAKGKAKVNVYGKGFRSNFPGSNPGCKVGKSIGKGTVLSDSQMECIFEDIAINKEDTPMNVSVALNSYSFTEEKDSLNYTAYTVSLINPSSGPSEGGTRIEVKGAGFFESKDIRCRFGVPGWYAYTTGQYIDYTRVICTSPSEFKIPDGGMYPFSVPFSIAFNDDEFSKFILYMYIIYVICIYVPYD